MPNKFKAFSLISLITLIFWALMDIFFGQLLLNNIKYSFHHGNVSPYYHHGFVPKVNNLFYWGGSDYTFCTDKNGFRNSCKKINNNKKKYDIAFIGDSMTEGPGLNFENTIVGIINKHFDKKEIINLASSSYSTMIYNHKVQHLIKNGYNFDEVIVLIDVSDIYDDTERYKISNNRVVSKNRTINKYSFTIDKIKFHLKRFLPLSYQAFQKIHKIFQNKNKTLNNVVQIENLNNKNDVLDNVVQIKNLNNKITSNSKEFKYIDLYLRAWTYDKNLKYDNKPIQEAIKISILQMDELYKFLKNRNIPLSIVVFPAPPQLAFDKENSLQVKIWENFCYQKCKNFINTFPYFFQEMKKTSFQEVNKKYFIENDVHFNKKGSEAIANLIIKNIK
jgi:hypothetical protein